MRRRIDRHLEAGGRPIALEVDGGMKVANIRRVAEAGADTFVAGSAIFGARDTDGGYRERDRRRCGASWTPVPQERAA